MFLYDDKFTGNGTIAPSSAPIPATRNENSLIILSWAIFSVGMLVSTIFIWNVRNQIKELVIKCWSTVRGGERQSDNASPASLNDIIFDPEEEQRASLSESLLPSNE